MPRRCTVCECPYLSSIEDELEDGGSHRDVATRYGLSPSAVWRHRGHTGPVVRVSGASPLEERARELLRAELPHDVGVDVAVAVDEHGQPTSVTVTRALTASLPVGPVALAVAVLRCGRALAAVEVRRP